MPNASPPIADDFVAPFRIEAEPVPGRIVRLGPAIDAVLSGHDYPAAIGNLVGEACALAALVGASMKFDGRLIVQAQGDGPVACVVADYDTSGALRGYCRFDPDGLAQTETDGALPKAGSLLGRGTLVITIDRGGDMDRYQGVTPLTGESLAECAEHWFAQSQQTPTRVRLAVGRADDGAGPKWRAGGLLLQNIAADEARGSAEEAWRRSQALFETVAADELVDPTVSAETLLWRLFHEDGVRLFEARPLRGFCRCSRERILEVLGAFPADERAAMVEDDGRIRVTCEYCARVFDFAPDAVD